MPLIYWIRGRDDPGAVVQCATLPEPCLLWLASIEGQPRADSPGAAGLIAEEKITPLPLPPSLPPSLDRVRDAFRVSDARGEGARAKAAALLEAQRWPYDMCGGS